MTYWNLKQVIFLEGKFDIAMSLDLLQSKLSTLDMIPKLSFTDLGKIKVLEEEELSNAHDLLF